MPQIVVKHVSQPLSLKLKTDRQKKPRKRVLTLFGTRPEVIKLAPVIYQLEEMRESIRTINVTSGQHSDLLYPSIEMFGIRVDIDLKLMTVDQEPSAIFGRIFGGLDQIVDDESPDLILVQGDTTTALAGALVGNQRHIPVAHVEAGLRSGNLLSPYPEEMNRRFITRLATYHFAATTKNRETLLQEGISEKAIFVTGNPVVDALQMVLKNTKPFCAPSLLAKIADRKCIVLTTHRRESFGRVLADNLQVLCRFVRDHEDVILVFPMHPNPNVNGPAKRDLCRQPKSRHYPSVAVQRFHSHLVEELVDRLGFRRHTGRSSEPWQATSDLTGKHGKARMYRSGDGPLGRWAPRNADGHARGSLSRKQLG